MTQPPATGRRSLLKRLTVLGAGAVGVGAAGASAASLAAPPSTPATTFRLHGKGWQVHSNTQPRGARPARGDRLSTYGELLDQPDGRKLGDFFGNTVSLRSPFASGPFGDASLEIHTFILGDGSLFGLGNRLPNGDPTDTFAIVGGTGRYAGARGTYVARQGARGLGGDGTADFSFHLTA